MNRLSPLTCSYLDRQSSECLGWSPEATTRLDILSESALHSDTRVREFLGISIWVRSAINRYVSCVCFSLLSGWLCSPYQGFSFRMSPACLSPGPFHWSTVPKMCGGSRVVVVSSSAVLYLSSTSVIQEWLPLDPRCLVTTSDPRAIVASERNANFLTISAQRLDQEAHRIHLDRSHHPHLPFSLREPGREGVVTLHRETFATSIGILASATADLIALLCIKKTPPSNLAAPTWPVGSPMKKTS